MQSIKKPYIEDFYKNESYLNILERRKPYDADRFFQNILSESFQINASIAKKEAYNAIKYLFKKQLPNKIHDNIFYYKWIKDMSEICILYSDIIKEDTITFSLKTSRGCKRYHIDNVPVRLLVTYYGKGTEWLPRNACDYAAYYNGENNDKIVKIKNASKFISPWSIAVFKGQKSNEGKKAILHRTPDEALNKKSLLMCLDSPTFNQI